MLPGLQTLRHRGFANLFWAGIVSQFGDAVYYLVFLFYARKVTGSDVVVGYVAAATGLPFLLLGPFAGVLADRLDRKRIMLTADLVSASVMFTVAVCALSLGALSAPAVVATSFCLSCVNTFFSPARRASVARLLPEPDLPAANALLGSAQNLMQLGGLALSVTLIASIEAAAPRFFLPLTAVVNGLTFLGSAWFCFRLPALVPERTTTPHFLEDLKEGFRVVFRDPVLRLATPLNGIMMTIISGWMVVYVAVNDQWFGGRYWTLGLVECSFFVVVLACTAVASRIQLRRPGALYAWGWLTCGLAVIPMAWATWYPAYLGLNALCGLVMPASWLAMSHYQQVAFPDSVRGRVIGAWEIVYGASQPLGGLLVGPSLAFLGIDKTYIWMGVALTVIPALALFSPSFRRAEIPSQA